MPFKIIRNDITKMHCDAIVNTANSKPIVEPGCDYAVYTAAGYDELLKYRLENIGEVPEGKVFLMPAFDLESRYIIYALSPCDKTDVIFSYFIENEIYDMIELDIQLEEHGEKCLIS
jgi:O-acetyl-ADP-ribose deacetylase (regulator of RNase III)